MRSFFNGRYRKQYAVKQRKNSAVPASKKIFLGEIKNAGSFA